MCCVLKCVIGGFVVIVLLASGACMIALEFIVRNYLGDYFNLGWILPLLLCTGVVSIAASLFATLGLFKCCWTKTNLFATMVCICFIIVTESGYMVKVHKGKEDMKDYLMKNNTPIFMGNMSEFYTNQDIAAKWTLMQAQLECCGKRKTSDWTDHGVIIPQSCCKKFTSEFIPANFQSTNKEDLKKLAELVATTVFCNVSIEADLKPTGCLEKLEKTFEKGFRILKWGVLGLLLFQIIAGPFFTYLFIKEVFERKEDDKSEKKDDKSEKRDDNSGKSLPVIETT